MKLFGFLQKKDQLTGLLRAKAEGLITEEEYLRITAERADRNLQEWLDKMKKKKGSRLR
jgi:hypothetical protein